MLETSSKLLSISLLTSLIACQASSVGERTDDLVKLAEVQEKLILRKPVHLKPVKRVPKIVAKEKAGPTGPIEAPENVAEVPADAEVSPTGLASRVLEAGTGAVKPVPKSKVKVHYSGWTADGRMFDSSVARGQVAEFQVSRVILGLTEGLQLMVVGEKRRFWIPGKLGYGESGGSTSAPAGAIVFDVELIAIR